MMTKSSSSTIQVKLNGSGEKKSHHFTWISNSPLNRWIGVNGEISLVENWHTPQQPIVWGRTRTFTLICKARHHPDTNNHLTVYTQNVPGLWANEKKIEYISRMMESKSILMFICFKRLSYKVILLMHSAEAMTYDSLWPWNAAQPKEQRRSGNNSPTRNGRELKERRKHSKERRIKGSTTRILSIDVDIMTVDRVKTKSKFRHTEVSVLTSYHPNSGYSESNINSFSIVQQASSVTNSIPKDMSSSLELILMPCLVWG